MKCELRKITFLGAERWGVYDSHGTMRQWATEKTVAEDAAKQLEELARESVRGEVDLGAVKP